MRFGPCAALLRVLRWSRSCSSLQSIPPIPRADLSATAIAAGSSHTCAIASGGGVKCWGSNGYGQLGIGSTTYQNSPAEVAGAEKGGGLEGAVGVICDWS